ncbi:D-alanine--D-alanine ligase family protein [Geodermatophilus sp. SYSU D00815]
MTLDDSFSDLGPVAIVAGGLSHERAVSLLSGERLERELTALGIDAHVVDADTELLRALRTHTYAAVLPTIHGDIGEDGTLQTVLEFAKVPFTGSIGDSCRLAWDKSIARTLTERAGLPAPQWAALTSSSFKELGGNEVVRHLVEDLTWPLVTKPNRGGSVLGVRGVGTVDELPAALMQTFAYGDTAVIESFTEGLDVSVAVVELDGEPQAAEPVGLEYDKTDQFDFEARYDAARIQVLAPAPLAEGTRKALQDAAVAAHRVLGLRDLSRTDFLVKDDGTFVLLEVAAIPGMTETSLFPFSVEAAGWPLGKVFGTLLRRAIERTKAA